MVHAWPSPVLFFINTQSMHRGIDSCVWNTRRSRNTSPDISTVSSTVKVHTCRALKLTYHTRTCSAPHLSENIRWKTRCWRCCIVTASDARQTRPRDSLFCRRLYAFCRCIRCAHIRCWRYDPTLRYASIVPPLDGIVGVLLRPVNTTGD